MHTSNFYNVYEPGFESFRMLNSLELTSGCGSCLSSDMVLISFYIKHRNKGGRLFVNQISAAAIIREQRLFEKRRLVDHLR